MNNKYWAVLLLLSALGACSDSDEPSTTGGDGNTVIVDSDGDGVSDENDAFPNDASETVDSDGDSVGDNSDDFINDATETTDTDGDGVGDNSDHFINDATETTDTDGDGVGDNSDDFPNDASKSVDDTVSACTQEQYTIVSATDDGTHNSGEGPENTIDGDTDSSSRWSSENATGVEKEIIFDLGESKDLAALQLMWHKGDERTTSYHIETSTDQTTWTRALESQTSIKLDSLGFEAVNLTSDVNSQYIKLTGLGNSSNDWNSLIEAQVFKCPLTETIVSDTGGTGSGSSGTPTGNIYDDGRVDTCDANGEILYNGVCDSWLEVYEEEHGVLSEGAYLTTSAPSEMTFDALAAQHVTSNGNGWRHELKIKSSGNYRVGMTEVYELFKATITADLDPGAKTIVAQHHASDTGTITKLYIADLSESGFDNAPDGTSSNSTRADGIFDVYIRLAKEDGSGETKHLLTTITTGQSFDFELINDHGLISTKINGQAIDSVRIEDSTASYFKFGNYQQAQAPVDGEAKLASGDADGDWTAFYNQYFSTSVITFTDMS